MLKIAFDESGNLGKKERYFVIAGIVPDNNIAEKRITNLVRRTRASFTSSLKRKELKGSLMTMPQKQRFLKNLCSKNDYRVVYLVADKNHIDPRIFADKNLTFNFLFGKLLKCFINSFSEDLELCIDNRTVKVTSRDSLQNYLKIEAYTKWNYSHELDIHLEDSENDDLLQAVDIIANTIYAKYNYNASHLYSYNSGYCVRKQHFPYTKFGT